MKIIKKIDLQEKQVLITNAPWYGIIQDNYFFSWNKTTSINNIRNIVVY
jgi:hypothetical protein